MYYVSYMNLGRTGTIGILNKIISQIKAFEECGYKVLYIYAENSILRSNFIEANTNDFNVKQIRNSIDNILYKENFSTVDFVYIRFDIFTYKFLRLLKKISNSKAKILLEIPTYPFIGEFRYYLKEALLGKKFVKAFKYCVKIIQYPLYSKIMHNYIERIVTFSEDDNIWGIKTTTTFNGIDTNKCVKISFNKRDKHHVTMICVSSCVKWHGYDRVIEGMREYYKKNKEVIVRLKIVGEGPELSFYKQLVNKYNLCPYVDFYGNVTGDDLNKLYNEADIALDAMGRHRVGVLYNSSLKGKEYAFYGLPIVSGTKTEFDNDRSFPFYFRVPADESPISINDIILFVEKIEMITNYRKKIHEYAISHFDMKMAIEPIITYMNSNVSEYF